MPHDYLSDIDLLQIGRHGLDTNTIEKQLEMFSRGASFIRLVRPVSPGDGLVRLPKNMLPGLEELYRKEAARGRAMSFVPASGAASRMFKTPLAALGGSLPLSIRELENLVHGEHEEAAALLQLLKNIDRFAFSTKLEQPFARNGSSLQEMVAGGKIRPILEHLLTAGGMNYADLPKALLAFHTEGDDIRTAMEEHLAEAAFTVRDGGGTCRLHFTVSAAHESLMRKHFSEARGRLEKRFGVRYEVSFSLQKPETDTVAAGPDGTPFRDNDGQLVFRPGGHGALIENLNDLEGEIVFMKNIDNVVPDRLKETVCRQRNALAGYLVLLEEKCRSLLRRLEETAGDMQASLVEEAASFVLEELNSTFAPGFSSLPAAQRKAIVIERLNRPIRVCGMVENRGEPGGGPYWVHGQDGAMSLQIVEKDQIDLSDHTQRGILEKSGYFNPVDLVCGLRDFHGKRFDLHRFIDSETFFISEKSHQGRNLRALELPGLWNGAMARWNTVFIEVPIETFNPVKTVLDLLRPQHQPV